MSPLLPKTRTLRGAFTLLELLIVVVIMGMVIALASFGIGRSLEAQRINTSANRLAAEISAAALKAVRENRSIEVRLIPITVTGTRDKKFGALQLFSVNPADGRLAVASEIHRLEEGVVVLDNDRYTTLLEHMSATGYPGGFTLHPNGTTDLPKSEASDAWCITLASFGQSEVAGKGLPPNYRTVVINAYTGGVRVY